MIKTETTSDVMLRALRNLIANDSYAMSFQSLGQYRTALLHHIDDLPAAPVIAQQSKAGAQPELTVWYGAMPESNGKSNFTAILKRKDAGPFDTCHITIDRSEYPDRVRYEADRVRWIIGELAEEPFILDYDADKHSGYKKPEAGAPTAPAEKLTCGFCKGTGDGKIGVGGCTVCNGKGFVWKPIEHAPTSGRESAAPGEKQDANPPMCEGCDDPAMRAPDGTWGLCQACIDFHSDAAMQKGAQENG